ncbi:MAG: hypothetical protein IKO26_07145 [Paludibacteraceae bacterium]|nr:hypothetical protein [Paludibacteraceae bacterium]
MEATIENKVADILRHMESYHTDDTTEKELRALSNKLLEVRRAMDKIDDKLRKGYWYYNQFYARWAAKRENTRQKRIEAWNASRQLDMFNT